MPPPLPPPLLLLLLLIACGAAALAPEPRRGVWGYFCYQDTASIAGSEPDPDYYPSLCWRETVAAPPAAMRGALMMLKWRHVEPRPGVFDWAAMDLNISKAAKLGLQLIIAIEVCKADPRDEATPDWLYDQVPAVNFTHSSKGTIVPPNTTDAHRCPFYLDGGFQAIFARLIAAFASHVAALPELEQGAVVAVQAMLGITGDDRPWNGNPINPRYWITDPAWTNYTRKMSLDYCAAFTAAGTRVLFNLENPGVDGHDDDWIVARCPGALIKQGIASHGYQLNGEQDVHAQWVARGLDKVYARGELAVEPNPAARTYGNWAQAPQWDLQANAEWALQFGLAQWNLYAGFLGNATFAPTLDFFNRQAPSSELATAKAAFVSFRESLDTDDVMRFPVESYGAVNQTHGRFAGKRLNSTRVLAIAAARKAYGAEIEDIAEATSFKSIVQKKGMFLNDVGYRIWPDNYAKFMAQLNASASSVGRWRVGPRDQGHGRFARALEQESGKVAIRLALAPGFAAAHRADGGAGLLNATLRVAYFDGGRGRWAMTYRATAEGGRGTAMTVAGQGTGRWAVAQASVLVAPASSAAPGAYDFELRSLDASDECFSLVEVLVN